MDVAHPSSAPRPKSYGPTIVAMDRGTWRKLQPKFMALQAEIRDVKSSINMAIGLSNSRDMMKVRNGLESLTAATTRSFEDKDRSRDDISNSIDAFGKSLDKVGERIDRVESTLQEQMMRMEIDYVRTLGLLYGLACTQERRESSNKSSSSLMSSDSSGSSRQILRSSASISVQSWAEILHFHTQVPDDALCVSYALNGNISALKEQFSSGLASPQDVSSTRGYSLLRWALYGQQYETCRFLLHQGADPHYRPISESDSSPSDKASDFLLRGGLSPSCVEALRLLADGNDFIESQNFQPLHRVVLGLSITSLEDLILANLEDIDIPDAGGRTALEWAAARGDERAVALLLSYGANPNVMDAKLNTPLTLAANQNHTTCVRILLEAGAETDPALPEGIKFGTPLNAARNAPDPALMKTLLDFGANVEATGVDGVTPLMHVARSQGARHAVLLLGYGANINAVAKDGRTPLTTAIIYNNHDVLRLLLDRWSEYSECPRLKGPNLLDLAAKHADIGTLRILAGADHFRLRCDSTYVPRIYAEQIRSRPGVSQEEVDTFDKLLDIAGKGWSENFSGSRERRGCLPFSISTTKEHSLDAVVDDPYFDFCEKEDADMFFDALEPSVAHVLQ